MEPRERFLQAAAKIVEGSDDAHDRDVIEEAHPADLAEVLRQLPLVTRSRSSAAAGTSGRALLPELDDHALLELVRALDEVEVSRILDEMPPEHAADVVDELPTEQAEKILDLMEEEKSEEVQEILEYPEHSAGRLMSPDFVAVHETAPWSRPSSTSASRSREERAFELYVVDDHRHLVGRRSAAAAAHRRSGRTRSSRSATTNW